MERNFLRSSWRIYSWFTLFNIYTNDIFVSVDEAFLSNYADDNALYSIQKTTFLTNLFLRKALCVYKRYYLTFGLNTTKHEFVLEDGTVVPSAEEHVVLWITFDSRLTIYSHLKQLSKNVANKLNDLTRIVPYLSCKQRWRICNSCFTRQLNSTVGASVPDNWIIFIL